MRASRTAFGRGSWPAERRSQQGFTAVELVIVMSIIVIGVIAIRPVVANARRSAQKRAALRGLVSTLAFARTGAVTQARLVRVIYQDGEGAFYAERQVDPRGDRSEFEPLPVLGRSRLALPEDIVVAGLVIGGEDLSDQTEAVVYFFPDGSTEGASVSLLDGAGNETVVELSAVTGRVTISEH